MDFSKIREMRKQNKKELSRASIGGDDDILAHQLKQQQQKPAKAPTKLHFDKTVEKKRGADAQKQELWRLYLAFLLVLSVLLSGVTTSPPGRLQCRWRRTTYTTLYTLYLYFFLNLKNTFSDACSGVRHKNPNFCGARGRAPQNCQFSGVNSVAHGPCATESLFRCATDSLFPGSVQ